MYRERPLEIILYLVFDGGSVNRDKICMPLSGIFIKLLVETLCSWTAVVDHCFETKDIYLTDWITESLNLKPIVNSLGLVDKLLLAIYYL